MLPLILMNLLNRRTSEHKNYGILISIGLIIITKQFCGLDNVIGKHVFVDMCKISFN